jgi:signal transduction histidine kinase
VEQRTFKRITLLIGVTMLLVLVTQIWRGIENYQTNKQRFINDVQNALDISIETYYADRAKNDVFRFTFDNRDSIALSSHTGFAWTSSNNRPDSLWQISATTHIDTLTQEQAFNFQFNVVDTNASQVVNANSHAILKLNPGNRSSTRFDSVFKIISRDTLVTLPHDPNRISQFAQKIMISLSEDRLNLETLSSQLKEELERKNLPIGFELRHETRNGLLPSDEKPVYSLNTSSKSTYLPPNESLILYFENASLIILKNGIGDLLVSFFIVATVMAVLLYLYRVIVNQKQLAMIKDDLISNITHEFKTPIATISSAIEGIAHFNETNDKEKTDRYLGISSDQLKKLNLMVEKLLETATIDSGELEINPEEIDVAAITQKVVKNYELIKAEKSLTFSTEKEILWYHADPFHLENALSNLVDNAIKYGGDKIEVKLDEEKGHPVWQIIDNGGNIDKTHKDRIFEKLYRIPKGNQHDIKGFGIGLYYARSIIEKHGGSVSLDVKPGMTRFTVTLN